MRHFNPIRASSPAKSLSSSTATLSESRSAIPPELLHLSSEDVDILDAIIARAGHSATTFFTVFKAYSDVLVERGLHPQEVVYYGKLLKLGTLKGKNWGEKWKTVKAQLNSVRQLLSSIWMIYLSCLAYASNILLHPHASSLSLTTLNPYNLIPQSLLITFLTMIILSYRLYRFARHLSDFPLHPHAKPLNLSLSLIPQLLLDVSIIFLTTIIRLYCFAQL